MIKEKLQRAGASIALDKILRYIDKNPQANIIKLINMAEKATGRIFPKKTLKASETQSAIKTAFGLNMQCLFLTTSTGKI